MTTAKRLLICLGCILAGSAIWAQPAEENPDATSTATTGTVAITLTVTVQTAGVKAVDCAGVVSILDTATRTVFSVSTTVAATGTGATRTCTISVPYSFVLASPSTDSLGIGYTISAPTGASPLGRNLEASPLKTIPLPKSGTTTPVVTAATI